MSEQPSENDDGIKVIRRFITFVAVLLVIISQVFVYTTQAQEKIQDIPAPFWINIAGVFFGVLLFLWGQVYRPGPRMQALVLGMKFSGRIFWIATSLALSLLAVLTMLLFANYGRTNYIPVLTFWVFAGTCYVSGFFKNIPSSSQVWEWIKLHKYELLGIGLVTLLGFILRFYELGDIPRVVNGDEGRTGLAAISTNTNPYANPFALWENFGALYLQGLNLAFNLFGISPFSLRLLAAIGGTLAIPALYLLARQIAGWRIALIAASLLSFSHTHIHFSRTIAVAYIQGTWLIPLELYFLLSGLTKQSSWRTALAGVILAVHFSVYLDSQIIASMILAYMIIAFLFLRPWFKSVLPQAFAFWGGFGIMILPEFVYILQQPGAFFDRLNKDGMFQSGWLAQEMANTGHSALQILGERIVHAFLSLIYYPSFDFYGSPTPTLSLISAAFFLLGLGIVLWEIRSPGPLLLNGYFWAGTLSVAIFSVPVSADTYRMLMVLPVVFLMAAIGLDRTVTALGFGWIEARKAYVAMTALTLLSLLVFNLWAYYFHFVGRCLYGNDDGPTRYASYLGNYARTVDKETELYLLSDDIYFYGSHQSVDFLSNRHLITNIKESADTLQVKPDEIIIATPNRLTELRTWADTHPGGELHYEYDCQQTILLAYRFP